MYLYLFDLINEIYVYLRGEKYMDIQSWSN